MKKLFLLLALALCISVTAKDGVRESQTSFAREALQPYVDRGELAGAINVFYNDGVQETCCIGYADVVLVPTVPQKPVIIIELKKDGDPITAIEQIKTRNYVHAFRYHPGRVAVLVGVTYDAKSKKHKCKIEKVENYRDIFENSK